MTRKKPKTYTTVECMVADIRRGSQDSGVRFLARVIRVVRRERGAEVRRLRRALRGARSVLAELEHLAPAQVPFLVDKIGAALAPRRRKS